ncbi:MAG: hypothetical protein HOP09_14820 [Hyphomicrobium sp.]|nr:hypothetical protein [Hyphomicrobium sp.]
MNFRDQYAARRWVEIRSLPPEIQMLALRSLERRAGPLPPPPARVPVCPHPEVAHTEYNGVTWCDLCSDEPDARARRLLSWVRKNGPCTSGDISAGLEHDPDDVSALMSALAAGGLVRNTNKQPGMAARWESV